MRGRSPLDTTLPLSYEAQEKILRRAFEAATLDPPGSPRFFPDWQPALRTVAITVNSPGGSPVQSSLLYRLVRKLANQYEVRVLTFAEDVAASGGYMLLCSGDEIYADPSSLVGSVGVVSSSLGLEKLLKRIDVEPRTYTAGSGKVKMSPVYEENLADVRTTRVLLDELHREFIDVVVEARGEKLLRRGHDEGVPILGDEVPQKKSSSGSSGAVAPAATGSVPFPARPSSKSVPKALGKEGESESQRPPSRHRTMVSHHVGESEIDEVGTPSTCECSPQTSANIREIFHGFFFSEVFKSMYNFRCGEKSLQLFPICFV